ncbi:MAG: glycosyltransferase [Pseudomonadota bacterium]
MIKDAAKNLVKNDLPATTLSAREFMDSPHTALEGELGPVIIISDALPERNGVGAYYKDLLDQLSENGYKATFLAPNPEKWQLLKFPLPGDSTQTVYLPSLFRFHKAMRRIRPKAIVVGTPGPFGLLGALWARRLGARLIVGFHTHFSSVTDLYSNRWLRNFSRFYFNIADNLLFRYGDQILANSDQMVDLAHSLGANNVEIMGTLLPPAALQPATAPLGELEHVLFAGRLAPEKRVHLVVDAARELPHIRFTLAGDGPLKGEFEEAARELPNLSLLGWVDRQQLLGAMDSADLLVLPSTVESFGTVALEAMARQRLALVSPQCGIVDWPDLVDNLFQIGADESVADALRRIAGLAGEVRRETASRAREAALKLNSNSVRHWVQMLSASNPDPNDKSKHKSNTGPTS